MSAAIDQEQSAGNPGMPKTRILFVVRDLGMGGVEKVLMQYLTSLSKVERVSCSLMVLQPLREKWIRDIIDSLGIELIDGLQMSPVPKKTFFLLKWVKKLYYHFQRKSLPWRVRHIVRRYDVLVDFTIYCGHAFRYSGKRQIGWYHSGLSSFDMRPEHLNTVSQYEHIVCLTDAFKADLAEAVPTLAPLLTRLYNPLDIDTIRSRADEPGIATNHPYFVAVQRFEAGKSTSTLIKAFEQFRLKHPEYWLYIVGEGSQEAELKALAQDPHIVFTGRQYNPYPIMKGARALVLSSAIRIGEGLPTVLLEAQALGVLCISSDAKYGSKEILMDGQAGWLYEAESVQACCDAMCRAVEQPEMSAEKVRTATANLHRFQADNIIRDFLQLIRA